MPRRKRPSADERRRQIVRYPDYQDHSDRSNDWIEKRRSEEANSAPAGGATKMFPTQLYQLLEAVDGTPLSQCVRWLPHGRAFGVVDSSRFESEVLPMYFPKQSALASFYRQLNAYGFLRLSSDKRSYYHELFLRNRPLLAELIPRHIHGRYSTRRTFDATGEPDLYAMTWLPDISRQNSAAAVVAATTIAADIDTLPPSSCIPRPTQKYVLGERTSIIQRTPVAKRAPVATTLLNTMQANRYDAACNDDSLPSSPIAQRLIPKSHDVFSGPLGLWTASPGRRYKDETNLSTCTRLPYRLSALSEPSHHSMNEPVAARCPANVSLDQRLIVGRDDFETANNNEAADLHLMHFKTEEACSDISSEDDISEWAEFLHDVDLDSSVGSNAK